MSLDILFTQAGSGPLEKSKAMMLDARSASIVAKEAFDIRCVRFEAASTLNVTTFFRWVEPKPAGFMKDTCTESPMRRIFCD